MNPAKYIEKEERKRGEGRYLHKTETTSIGYGFGEAAYVKLCWPYEEREKSVALDSMETPAQAFYPNLFWNTGWHTKNAKPLRMVCIRNIRNFRGGL